jgi:hypothetical protein
MKIRLFVKAERLMRYSWKRSYNNWNAAKGTVIDRLHATFPRIDEAGEELLEEFLD